MIEIPIKKCPYEKNQQIFENDHACFHEGLTAIIGRNGSGKSTLLNMIKDYLEQENKKYIYYDNYNDGGSSGLSNALYRSDIETFASAAFASEGQRIMCFLGTIATKIGQTIRSNPDLKEYWVLLDGIDSGASVDNIGNMCELFDLIIKTNPDKKIYILVSSNTYAMCENNRCYNVYNGEEIFFHDYGEYKSYIKNMKTYLD